MDWIALSLVSAMAQVLRNVSMKSIGHNLDEYINVLGRFFMTLPFAGVVSAAPLISFAGVGKKELPLPVALLNRAFSVMSIS